MSEIIIYIPFETEEQAKRVGDMLLESDLAYVYRVQTGIYQAWKEESGKLGSANICVLRLRTVKENAEKIYQKVKEIHPWPVFCFEMVQLIPGSK